MIQIKQAAKMNADAIIQLRNSRQFNLDLKRIELLNKYIDIVKSTDLNYAIDGFDIKIFFSDSQTAIIRIFYSSSGPHKIEYLGANGKFFREATPYREWIPISELNTIEILTKNLTYLITQ